MTMLDLPTAGRLLRQILPGDEDAARARWIDAARNLTGETAEIRALLSTAIASGLVTEGILWDIGLVDNTKPVQARGRVVVLRRHGPPDPSGHLSLKGRAACDMLRGQTFNRYFSSDLPRSIETTVAIGGSGTNIVSPLGPPPAHIENIVGSHQSFSHWLSSARRHDNIAAYCQELVDLIRDLAVESRTLVVSHDDTIQAVATGMLGEKVSSIGRNMGYLEGIALFIDGDVSGIRLGCPPW
jgi:hypothetical protein